MTGRPIADRPFTGRHMLIIMLLFFGVIIAVNITMAVLANRSWTGLVVKNSYVASQHFNEQLEQARIQQARGWQSSLSYQSGTVSFELRDRSDRPVVIDGLQAVVGRPATEKQDRVVELRHLANGRYEGRTELDTGHWALRITGGEGATAYRQDVRIFVKDDATHGKVDRQ